MKRPVVSEIRTGPATHLDAIRQLAKTVGLNIIHDSGPCSDGKMVIFADAAYADTYMVGGPNDVDGVFVKIVFNERGEVKFAHKEADGVPKGDITGTVGNAGQRLLWTLHLFSRR